MPVGAPQFPGSRPRRRLLRDFPQTFTGDFFFPQIFTRDFVFPLDDLAAELRSAEMANPSVEIGLGDDDATALDVVVDEAYEQPSLVVDVIEAVSEIGGDLHSRHPRVEHREVNVPRVPETIRKVGTVDELVHEVDVVAGDGCAEELDDADVVAAAHDGEEFTELLGL